MTEGKDSGIHPSGIIIPSENYFSMQMGTRWLFETNLEENDIKHTVVLKCCSFFCVQYSRLSKQYGMEIYLKKEHLHYTGSVKERGVLYLLTSLTQVNLGWGGGSSCQSGHS